MYKKKCIVEYDGTDFYGWQKQRDKRTVQETIEQALSKIYKSEIKIVGSGRTDTGVHALGQVFHYSANKYLSNKSVLMGLNSLLPPDIAVKQVEDTDVNFHAQKSAINKTYLYKIFNNEIRSAIYRNRAWWIRNEISLQIFDKYLQKFVGEKDFSAMCLKRSLPENPVRKINFIKVTQSNKFINVEINADGFLHNMVRNIIGTSVELYFSNAPFDKVDDILKSKDRCNAGPTAPARGLYLKEVFY